MFSTNIRVKTITKRFVDFLNLKIRIFDCHNFVRGSKLSETKDRIFVKNAIEVQFMRGNLVIWLWGQKKPFNLSKVHFIGGSIYLNKLIGVC